jgi:uncharacterized membrane protein
VKVALKNISLYPMALLYTCAGINHFLSPAFYEAIMPSPVPFHTLCIVLSGICEIALGILLFPLKTRKAAAWLIIAMLIAFFAVHIHMLLNYWDTGGTLLWIAIIRIPIQFVLIRWAYVFTKKPQL